METSKPIRETKAANNSYPSPLWSVKLEYFYFHKHTFKGEFQMFNPV